MRLSPIFFTLVAAVSLVTISGCGSTPSEMSNSEKTELDSMSRSAIADFKKADPAMEKFFVTSYGYAIFPNVTTGAVVVGGSHGEGEVFQGGKLTGYADVSKANIGAQIGGQSYQQIVFFQNEGSYAAFTNGTYELDAKASAVAASEGASSSADYQKGVLVFTRSISGLMVQAAVGGQKFRFRPAAK